MQCVNANAHSTTLALACCVQKLSSYHAQFPYGPGDWDGYNNYLLMVFTHVAKTLVESAGAWC